MVTSSFVHYRTWREQLGERPDSLLATCEVAALVAAALLLPAALIDLLFDTDFLTILSLAVLAVFAIAFIGGVWMSRKHR